MEDKSVPVASVVGIQNSGEIVQSGGDGYGALFHPNASEESKQTGMKVAFGCMFINCGSESGSRNRWVPPKYIQCFCLMGGVEMDFSNAEFVHKDIYVTCLGMMGGISLILPPGVRVVNNGIAICGGFTSEDVRNDGSVLNNPTIHISGLVLMGGVSAETSKVAPAIRILQQA